MPARKSISRWEAGNTAKEARENQKQLTSYGNPEFSTWIVINGLGYNSRDKQQYPRLVGDLACIPTCKLQFNEPEPRLSIQEEISPSSGGRRI